MACGLWSPEALTSQKFWKKLNNSFLAFSYNEVNCDHLYLKAVFFVVLMVNIRLDGIHDAIMK